MTSLLPHRRALFAALAVAALVLAILLAMHRPVMCECGTIKLWHGVVQSSENSQHITDWYSPSHLIHGLLFYFFAHILWRRLRLFGGVPTRWALPIAIGFEGFWEVLENTPFIINRYREVTVSWGYAGDSIVNSMSDIGWMTLGFLLASRLPAWASVALGVGLELFTLAMIRDNLTLNVLMLVWPVDAIVQWQAGA
ncbi:hypothetical protein SZ64_10890 [Erythrobacter sp. SG61-1L]|uniref:DUF2585 domain-containing protein n=1 Tax=Erythrobacter sp. SG61-1L TaxID=1603897 RepID=UPI0006C90FEB|nr:DUF2585 domain-containing protein [Erythrobacter sp. SG61-1L]KPL68565.1 hypothetical protein SZ64_10890 [Erythrobacter sp. SG61-1L]